ncbi:MAG: PD40 domain-containing protein, partial [Acidobacteria bacterium]|nr:PD40 domain-containing protein [Acidobacteriota bacterium]
DGSRIAVEIFDPDSPAAIFIYGIGTGTWEKLTDTDVCSAPLWTADSERIFFNCDAVSAGSLGNIYARPANFSAGRSEAFLDTDGGAYPISWSGDGKLLTHEMIEGQQRRRILVLPLGEDSTAYSLLDDSGRFNQRNPMISPSGNWMAYVESQSGQDEIYVRSFPDPSRRYAISRDGGASPMWGREDRELFYRGPEGMMLAHIDFETEPQVQVEREVLFPDDRFFIMPNAARTMYDYDRENDRFLMSAAAADDAQEFHLVVVVNWFEELKALAPPSR